mgnify:CR=1 FL=1
MTRPGTPRSGFGAAALAATLLSGCFWATTKSEGETLRRDVDALDARLATKEEDLEDKVKKLESIIAEATKVLKRNSADLGADVEAMRTEMREMHGLLTAAKTYVDQVQHDLDAMKASHDQRLASLDQRLAALEVKGAQTNLTADELWTQGKTAFEGASYNDARDKFKRLVAQFPGHERADDAQYFRGEAYFQEKDYDGAIREYGKVWDKYAESPLADDAMFRAGEAAQLLLHCTEARAYFGLLRQKYPTSSLKKKSEDKDKDLKKGAKDQKVCVS